MVPKDYYKVVLIRNFEIVFPRLSYVMSRCFLLNSFATGNIEIFQLEIFHNEENIQRIALLIQWDRNNAI